MKEVVKMLMNFEEGKNYVFSLKAYMDDLKIDYDKAMRLRRNLENKLVKPIGSKLGMVDKEMVSVTWCKEV